MTDIEKKAFEAYPRLTGCDAITLSSQEEMRKGYIKCAKEYESLPKIHGWVARDEDEMLKLCENCPKRIPGYGWVGEDYIYIDKDFFPEITSESEPVEVELLIRKI